MRVRVSWAVAAIVDYGLLHGQMVENLLGDKPRERVVKDKGVETRMPNFQLSLNGFFMGNAASERN